MADQTARPAVERVTPPAVLVRVGNPVMRTLLASPLHKAVSSQLLLLHFKGRRSGKAYTIPVGYRDIDGTISLLTNSGWRKNFRDGADVELTLRGRHRPAHATLVEDPEVVARAYERIVTELGWEKAQRRLGIKVNAGRPPTFGELKDAVRSAGLSIVRLELR